MNTRTTMIPTSFRLFLAASAAALFVGCDSPPDEPPNRACSLENRISILGVYIDPVPEDWPTHHVTAQAADVGLDASFSCDPDVYEPRHDPGSAMPERTSAICQREGINLYGELPDFIAVQFDFEGARYVFSGPPEYQESGTPGVDEGCDAYARTAVVFADPVSDEAP